MSERAARLIRRQNKKREPYRLFERNLEFLQDELDKPLHIPRAEAWDRFTFVDGITKITSAGDGTDD